MSSVRHARVPGFRCLLAGHGRGLVVFVTVTAMVATLLQAVVLIAAPRTSRALASAATGTAGVFVPLTARLVDPSTHSGGVPQPTTANSWMPVQVEGQAGVPASGVASVAISITVSNATAMGVVSVEPSSTDVPVTALIYDSGTSGENSGSTIAALADNGSMLI